MDSAAPFPSIFSNPDSADTYMYMVPGADHVPFGAVVSWDITPGGRLLIGTGVRYEIFAIALSGDTVARIQRTGATLGRIPRRLRRDSLSALRARRDTLPVPASEIVNLPEDVRRLRLPETYPAHGEIRVGTDGRIWIQRWMPQDPSVAVYDVLNPNGI